MDLCHTCRPRETNKIRPRSHHSQFEQSKRVRGLLLYPGLNIHPSSLEAEIPDYKTITPVTSHFAGNSLDKHRESGGNLDSDLH